MGLIGLRGKKPPLFSGTARNDDARRSQQSILKAITAPSLADNSFLWKFARLVCDCFVQVWIECFPLSLDRLQSIFSQQIAELFLDENHSGVNGRVRALLFCCRKAKLKIVNN